MKGKYTKDIRDLADIENGWHFSAIHTSEKQLKAFRIEDMALKMQQLALELWDLIGLILSADRKESKKQRSCSVFCGISE